MSLDDASESKPPLQFDHEHSTLRKPARRPRKLRRFLSISSRKSKEFNSPNMTTKPGSTPPLQALSPRPTESEPWPKTQIKRSISNFFLPRRSFASEAEPAKGDVHSDNVRGPLPATNDPSQSPPRPAVRSDGDRLQRHGHVQTTDTSCQSVQMQPRKDSVMRPYYDMPAATSRNAALTSHPVGKEDVEGEDGFETQNMFWGRQKKAVWSSDAWTRIDGR